MKIIEIINRAIYILVSILSVWWRYIRHTIINKKLVLAGLMFLLILAVKTNVTAEASLTSPGKKAGLYFGIVTAEYELASGNLQKAFEFLKQTHYTDDERMSTHILLRLLMKAERYDLIAQQKNLFKDDFEIQLIFVKAYLSLEKNEEAERLLLELNSKYPGNAHIAYHYSSLLISNKRFEKALQFIDYFLSQNTANPKRSLFNFLKAKIFSHLKRFQEAKEAINESLKFDISFDQAWLFKAFLLEHLGEIDQAIESYKSFLSLTGKEILVHQKLVQLLFNQGRFQEAEEELRKNTKNTAEYFFDLALIEWKGKEFARALKDINQALEKNPHSKNALLLKVEILFSMQKIIPLLNFLKNCLLQNPENKDIPQILLLLKKSGDISPEAIIEILHSIIHRGKENKKLWIVLGDLYLEKKNLKKSATAYEQALRLNKDKQLTPKLLYQVAYLYLTMKEKEKIEPSLKTAIEIDKSYYPPYNLLAYYYVLTNQKLNFASILIDKALKKNPNNVAFLDTKAFLLLKLGKQHEAIKILKKAVKLNPDNKIIKKRLSDAKK